VDLAYEIAGPITFVFLNSEGPSQRVNLVRLQHAHDLGRAADGHGKRVGIDAIQVHVRSRGDDGNWNFAIYRGLLAGETTAALGASRILCTVYQINAASAAKTISTEVLE